MKQSCITFLLLLLMSIMGTNAYAHDIEVANSDGKTIYYVWTNNQTELAVSYRGDHYNSYSDEYTGSVVIPASVYYNGTTYPVTRIGICAFTNCCIGLTSVNIPSSVTSIGEDAFVDCYDLTSVNIPSSVTSIGSQVFSYCWNLTSVVVEASTPIAIDDDVFLLYDNGSTNEYTRATLYVPYGSKTAYQAASGWRKFKEIVEMTPSSPIISFADANVKALCVANWDTNGDGELSEAEAAAVTDLGSVFYSNDLITSFDELRYFTGLTSIDEYAFYGSKLTSVIIPNSVTSIGELAFFNCSSLTNVTIGNSVTNIGGSAFKDCSGLTSVDIPNSVTSIGGYAFENSSGLTNVTIGNSVTTIGNGAFLDCSSLYEVDYNATNCTSMGSYSQNYRRLVFQGCTSLAILVIGNNVQNIPSNAFRDCSSLTNVTIGNSVTSIGKSAFKDCSGLTSVDIPNSVTSIGDYAFDDCFSLTNVTIGNSVTSIGFQAFSSCRSLASVAIPNSVENIDKAAFIGCYGLTSVTIGNSVTSIGDNAFYGCSGMTSLTIGYSVTSIGTNAFKDCSSLHKVDYNATNCKLQGTFEGLTSLTILNIGDNVQCIPEFAFNGCYGLTSLTIGNSVISIGQRAFQGCNSLTSVIIPNSVTYIGTDAFNCSSLTSVTAMRETPVSISSSRTFANRVNATLYVPSGCKAAYQTADYWNEFKTIKEYLRGDVNLDEETDVVDVVDIARYVVNNPSEAFHVLLADLNSDKTVNVADAVVLVNMIAGDQNFSRATAPHYVDTEEMLTLEQQGADVFILSLQNWRDYTAFQFDLYLPAGTDMEQVLLSDHRKQHHQLLYNKVGEGHYRVAVLSTSNQMFRGNSGELLRFRLNGVAENIVVSDILFFTTDGTSYMFDDIRSGTMTNVMKNVQQKRNEPLPVYDLQGRRIGSKLAKKGIYIVNGKKVLK